MSYLPEKVLKYLSKYSIPKWKLELAGTTKTNYAVVIPAICEYENIKILLNSLLLNDAEYFPASLFLFVINNSPSSAADVKEDNLKTIDLIRSIISKDLNDNFKKRINASGLRLALVDAATKGNELPEKDAGAGLARKIGMDLALSVFDYSTRSKNLIISLDADCTVRNNYLTEIVNSFREKDLSAAVIKFEHKIEDQATAAAIICYEIFFRYYLLGLKLANSPFAFHTVGSTMAVDYQTYISIEGMNKRKAGEEFYFLEKIAKRSNIEEIRSTTVYPSARSSWRAPFGTGQRVKRFLDKIQNEYLLYDPESFLILKAWLILFNKPEILSSTEYLSASGRIHPVLNQFLVENKFEHFWNKILNSSKSKQQLNKQKRNWFDGFRTLKLIHFLRDKSFPMMNMFDALDNILCCFNYSPLIRRKHGEIPELKDQLIYLNILRELT